MKCAIGSHLFISSPFLSCFIAEYFLCPIDFGFSQITWFAQWNVDVHDISHILIRAVNAPLLFRSLPPTSPSGFCHQSEQFAQCRNCSSFWGPRKRRHKNLGPVLHIAVDQAFLSLYISKNVMKSTEFPRQFIVESKAY